MFLFGANVTNNGVIHAPNGQVVLAAGTAAYVTASIEPSVRGVQVIVENGGESRNTGYISAPTGNISMNGMMVRQSGVLVASTSVNEAGSITLLAGDGLYTEFTNHEVHVKRTGTLESSPGSLTAVLPEEDGLTATIGQPQPQSLIRLEGETVNLLGGSSIWAPGARVALNASSNPANLYALDYPLPLLVTSSAADAGRVYIGDGAVIDVAGLKLVPIAAAESAAKVNARGNEFRDSPLQRDGILAGKDVWVDVRGLISVAADRVYTPGGLLEVSGYLGLAQRNIDQRLTAAGSVSIFSTGDAILRPGAFVDISGGSLIHQAGYVPGTRLIGADGRLYDINQAPADVVYVGVCCEFRVNHSRWGVEEVYSLRQASRYQAEHIEGTAAGAVSLTARSAEFDASVNATTVSGVYQRTAQSQPAGGSLTIGSAAGAGMLIQPNNVMIAPTVPVPDDVFANSSVTGAFRDLPTPVLPSRVRDPNTLLSSDRQQTLYLSADLLDQAGYGTININAQTGGIRVASGAELRVAPGGAINLTSTGLVAINGSLSARAGAVTLKSGTSSAAADIVLSAGAAIDTRGLWVNELAGRSRRHARALRWRQCVAAGNRQREDRAGSRHRRVERRLGAGQRPDENERRTACRPRRRHHPGRRRLRQIQHLFQQHDDRRHHQRPDELSVYRHAERDRALLRIHQGRRAQYCDAKNPDRRRRGAGRRNAARSGLLHFGWISAAMRFTATRA